ncbi:MAG TPA: tetraacyldisaccharide 4'-kinase [Saprospiraceae bacterium]|nr:tetraacyldisaccharide 4'-kinase [Saprospiraceae bacterium]HPI08805.1 tetraacyldisaccharide 4'-kinase [Saprospiraceae bacterium]
MPDDIVLRVLLLPFALLYGIGIGLRDLLYRIGVLRSVRFDLPVISVGNLSVGGAGKSPHIEYLLRWLGQYIDVAVLSRGYGRKTTGYYPVTMLDSAEQVGDEPLQFKRKFPEAAISVSESRALGVPELVKNNPASQCVLLDDAFQHLAVTPGLNVLLTEFNRPFTRDWLLPSGRLREWRYGYRRADIIIITKCPADLTARQRRDMLLEIDPYHHQQVFFSKYEYGEAYHLMNPEIVKPFDLQTDMLLVSAIANTDYLLNYLAGQARSVQTLEFTDHHYFKDEDLQEMKRRFERMDSKDKIIVTTEKDATRLELHRDFFIQHNLPVFVLPVQVAFCDEDEPGFQAAVKEFLTNFKV